MNLPKLFTAHDQSSEPRLVLCLAVSNTRLQALLLRVGDAQTTIVEKSRVLEYTDAAVALIKADEALQDLGPESESLNQIIFCFESSWVKDGDIAEVKRPLVKKITTELSLEPLGFIVISEALAHYYVQQNALFSGLLFLFTTDHVMVNLVAQGVIKQAETVGRSDNAVADVEEALARFALKSKSETQLPPKMVLASFDLNAEELRKQQQQLLDYSWDGQKLFLQAPTIDVVPPDAFVMVMALEAARAVALAHGLPVPQVNQHSTVTVTAPRSAQVEPPAKASPSVADLAEPEFEPESEPELESNLEPFQDPYDESQSVAPSSTQELAVETAAMSFGIPISPTKIAAQPELETARSGDFSSEFAVVPVGAKSASKSTTRSGPGWLSALTKPYHGKRSVGFFAIVGLVTGVITLIVVAVMAVLFMSSAQIQATLTKQLVSKEVEITLDPTATTTDPEARILAAKKVTKVLEDQSSMSTTGTLLVGDKAKGKVRLFNKTSSEKSFAAGSIFTTKNLSFKLDAAVTVASASSHTSGITFGQADGTVTALAIGDESNLKKDTELVIDSYSTDTFSALVTDGLTGGASREVRVVAAADRAELLKDLRGELLQRANGEFAAQSKDGTYFLPNARITKETPSYSAKEGDEATQLTLSLSIEVEALSYTAADLQPIAKQVLAAEVPAGFELVGEDPQILSAPDASAASGSGKLKLSANISSAAYPTVVESELIKVVLGKSLEAAQADLEALDTISSATVTLQPSFIKSLRTSLPNDEKRIHLQLIRE